METEEKMHIAERYIHARPLPASQVKPSAGYAFPAAGPIDNRIVEQKKGSLVRSFLGYERLDTVAQTLALNRPWWYCNLFQPVLHLQENAG